MSDHIPIVRNSDASDAVTKLEYEVQELRQKVCDLETENTAVYEGHDAKHWHDRWVHYCKTLDRVSKDLNAVYKRDDDFAKDLNELHEKYC